MTMALRCDWLVLCERVIEDSQSGSLTLVNCLDHVQAWSVPSTLPGFGFAARFSRTGTGTDEDGEYEFRFLRTGEVGTETVIVTTEATLGADNQTLRVFFNFAMLRLFREETVEFRIDWRRPAHKWRRGPAVPLKVTLFPAEVREEVAADLARLHKDLTEQTSGLR